jgi:hydrogenase expression/formation protein HypE
MSEEKRDFGGLSCPAPIADYEKVILAHGSGGSLTQALIQSVFFEAFKNPMLDKPHDGAVIPVEAGRIAFTTDSFIVSPLFFPGGDIGSLAVHGTVNDLAMCGARPLALSAAYIIEEGLPMETLRRIASSMGEAAKRAGVPIVTGDTKVVNRGKGDGVFINTAGIGVVPAGVEISPSRASPGDRIIVNGEIAAHGIAVMSMREGLGFESSIVSDSAPLNGIVAAILAAGGEGVHVLRDPTRGGVASVLNEIAKDAGTGILLREKDIPVAESVRAACAIFGFDPLYVANEGKLLAFVRPEAADAVLEAMRADPLGRGAKVIGEVVAEHPGMVYLRSAIGGTSVVSMLSGEQLPRIC